MDEGEGGRRPQLTGGEASVSKTNCRKSIRRLAPKSGVVLYYQGGTRKRKAGGGGRSNFKGHSRPYISKNSELVTK